MRRRFDVNQRNRYRPVINWVLVLGLLAPSLLAGCTDGVETDGPIGQPIGGDVYQVVPLSCIGEIHVRATAMAIAEDLVATAAHSFEGAVGARLRDVGGTEVQAEVVYADFDKDIALLRLGRPNTNLFTGAEAEDNQSITVVGFPSAETGPEIKEGTVLRTVTVTLDGVGRRQALELEVDIERGDSGGPVVDEQSRAVGMVFAGARSGARGWAVTYDEVEEAVARLEDGAELLLPDRCRE